MIYKLFTGQWIDISQVLTIEGPKDTTNAYHERIGAFYVHFKFKDSPVTYSKKLKYEPRTLDCDPKFAEEARADWAQFEKDFGAFVHDWMQFSIDAKTIQRFESQ